jgi:hypothetical protein
VAYADCGIHSQTIRIIKGSGGAPKAETMRKLSDSLDDQLYEINGLAERRTSLKLRFQDFQRMSSHNKKSIKLLKLMGILP